jgi:transketolase
MFYKTNLDDLKLIARTVSMLSIDAVERANSGHPGLPMGAALYSSLLWAEYLRFNPANPNWLGRDRFILSAGHGSMLLYSLLNIFGFDLPLAELKNFRQLNSLTPGHPEFSLTKGVEATTGPLGQGAANSVGIALSSKLLVEKYKSDLFNFRVFALVSDGDLMEGVSAEAASLAGHLKLGNLIYLYDDNKITLAGKTDVCFTESVGDRYRAYGWQVLEANSSDVEGLRKAYETAINNSETPTIICIRSIIGEGSPNLQDTYKVHGAPLGKAETKLTKESLGWPVDEEFHIPPSLPKIISQLLEAKKEYSSSWEDSFNSWQGSSELAKELTSHFEKKIPSELETALFKELETIKNLATRDISGKALQIASKYVPFIVGGSADLETSTKTTITNTPEIQANCFVGRNIRYGVREHAMGAIANGLAYEGCWIPLTSTFLVFSDYMRPAIRLAALSHLQSIFVFTHDSIWVGEDGPTHQPVEQLQSLRLIPNLKVYRPASTLEISHAYFAALHRKNGPTAIVCSRQHIDDFGAGYTFTDVAKGAYTVRDFHDASSIDNQIVLVATGSEVPLACEVRDILYNSDKVNCRVVSMPCVEDFHNQALDYKQKLLPAKALKISIELGVTMGWKNILGDNSYSLGIDHFGASAPGDKLADYFNFTPTKIAERIRSLL